MKKFSNHTPGMRGINTKGGVVWIDSGKSVEIDPKDIVGDLPDLGKAPVKAASEDDDLIAEVQAENADLKKQVDAQAKQIADLTAENEKLKKPAKPA